MRFAKQLTLLALSIVSCGILSPDFSNQTNEINILNQQPGAVATPSLFDQIMSRDDGLVPSSRFGSSAEIESIKIMPLEYEIDTHYALESGEKVVSPSGAQHLWIFIQARNVGANAASTDFIVELYYAGELLDRVTFGEYEPVNKPIFRWNRIFPDQVNEGWVLFEVPENVDLSRTYLAIRPLISPTEYTTWKIEE